MGGRIISEQRRQDRKKRNDRIHKTAYGPRGSIESTVSPAELQRIIYEEEYAANNLMVAETRSSNCDCDYKVNGDCPFGLKPHKYFTVDESKATELRILKTDARNLGKPVIKETDSGFKCLGYWKAYLQH